MKPFAAQRTAQPLGGRPDNLHERVTDDGGAQGRNRSGPTQSVSLSGRFRQSGTKDWRHRPDLNRGWRFCRQGRIV
jgi:hypothetical protein